MNSATKYGKGKCQNMGSEITRSSPSGAHYRLLWISFLRDAVKSAGLLPCLHSWSLGGKGWAVTLEGTEQVLRTNTITSQDYHTINIIPGIH